MEIDKLPLVNISDNDSVKYAKPFLPDNPVIIEAGACDAEDTKIFKKTWPDCTVYCFEPNPDLFKKASIAIAGLSNVEIEECALADYCGMKTFYMSEFEATSSFYPDNSKNVDVPKSILDSMNLKDKSELRSYSEKPIPVKCKTIDSFVNAKGILRVDYLWLDVEGAELNVLRGAINTLKTVKVLSVEWGLQEFRKGVVLFDDLYQFIISQNFEIKYIWKAHENWMGNAIFINNGNIK